MESHRSSGGRTSSLHQPLGGLTTPGLSRPSAAADSLLREMPPPGASMSRTPLKSSVPAAQALSKELEEEGNPMEDTNMALTRAVMMQSQALSNLVSQLATGDGVELAALAFRTEVPKVG